MGLGLRLLLALGLGVLRFWGLGFRASGLLGFGVVSLGKGYMIYGFVCGEPSQRF